MKIQADLKGSFLATPACGLLRTGQQQAIVICLISRDSQNISVKVGKIAIDYAFVHPFAPRFDRNVFKSTEKRRHVLQAIIN
ncbi:hypothetical protein GCK32_015079 [Trichostrongylus colubriformis]|uniref:Uncharacterized protein n=1 Tax=Trichostrongylus colubriformis TaxID=6319 RepID=A0AAN8FDG0_TRICO